MELLAAWHALRLFTHGHNQMTPDQTQEAQEQLHRAHLYKIKDTSTVAIYTDSMYTIKCVEVWAPRWQRNGWRTADGKSAVQNQRLIESLLALKVKCRARFVHVRGHTHEPSDKSSKAYRLWFGNHAADRMAAAAVHGLVKNPA
jgi:ribonuclease HI